MVFVGPWKSAGNGNCKYEESTGLELVMVGVNGYGGGGYFSKRRDEAEMVVGLGGLYGRMSELVVTLTTICWYTSAYLSVGSRNHSDL